MGTGTIFMKGDKAKWDMVDGKKDMSLLESRMQPWRGGMHRQGSS